MEFLKNLGIKQLLLNDKEEIEEFYSCIICRELIFNKKMLSCINGCCFCEDCWIKSRVRNCPTCKIRIESINSLSRNRIYEHLFLQIKIYCPYSLSIEMKTRDEQNGCKEIIKLEQWEIHQNNCQFRFVKCDNSIKCTEIMRFNQLLIHKESNCNYSMTKCSYCFKLIRKNQMKYHYNNHCQNYIVVCPNKCLNNNIKRKELIDHINNDCLYTVLKCKYKEGGCNETFIRMVEPLHYINVDHSGFMEKLIEKQSNENLILKSLLSNSNSNFTFNSSWIIDNFSIYLLKSRIGLSQTIDSPIINIGPFKIGLTIYINKFKNSIILCFEDKSNFFITYNLYYQIDDSEIKGLMESKVEISKDLVSGCTSNNRLILNFTLKISIK